MGDRREGLPAFDFLTVFFFFFSILLLFSDKKILEKFFRKKIWREKGKKFGREKLNKKFFHPKNQIKELEKIIKIFASKIENKKDWKKVLQKTFAPKNR